MSKDGMNMMKFFVADRQEGKSTELVIWIRRGVRRDAYPGWTRIIVTPNEQQAGYLRKNFNLDYHQVYSLIDWKNRAPGIRPVEIGIDNVDMFLQSIIGGGPIEFVTATGEVYERH